jgi:hypothetical protein
MQTICTYWIEIRGQIREQDLNAMSPLPLKVVGQDHGVTPLPPLRSVQLTEPAGREHLDIATVLTICTDQAGLIGMMRHLHSRGIVFLAMRREG